MAVLNFAHRQLTAKIVYFGPIDSGGDAQVRTLWEQSDGPQVDHRGRLHQLGPAGTSFFELRLEGEHVAGFAVRYRIYSLPSGIEDSTHQREVLRQVDALVLVVDCRPGRGPANEEALLELETLVHDQGLDLAKLPVVIQLVHTDHPEARPRDDVLFALNPFGFPVVDTEGSASVREAFEQAARRARERLAENLAGRDGALQITALHDVRGTPPCSSPTPAIQTAPNKSPPTPPPADEIEVPFQPRDFAGSHPVRVMAAAIEDGQVYVDMELERMGGGGLRQLRVRLANRPTDSPAVERSSAVASPPSVAGVTDHLPDVIEIKPTVEHPDLPPVLYGIIGVIGGMVAGVLLGFLLFT